MQYTIRGIRAEVDQALRARARAENKSLNEVTVAVLSEGLGLRGGQPRRSLRDIARTWRNDPATEAALQDQNRIDEDLWK